MVSKGSITALHECTVSETVCKFQINGLVSKCLQFSTFVSMETVFCNQLVSKNQSLWGKLFANSFPKNGPHVTILIYHHVMIASFMLYIFVISPLAICIHNIWWAFYTFLYQNFFFLNFTLINLSMLGGSLVTTAWRVLRLRMEETPSSFGE
jgi:hypothetical protein